MSKFVSYWLHSLFLLASVFLMQAVTCSLLLAQSLQKHDIDLQVSPYLEEKIAVGLCVGIIKSGESQVFGYGRFHKDSPAKRPFAEGKTRELRFAAWKSSISVYNRVPYIQTL